MLVKARLRKVHLAKLLGISAFTITKWKTMAPRYAIAYLELYTEHHRVLDNIAAEKKQQEALLAKAGEKKK
jgi:hypothetical protein